MVNDNAVTLAFPPLLSALHPTVNISRLKLYRDGSAFFPDRPQRHPAPPAVDTDTNGVTSYEVECIVAQRGPPRNRQLLVRWAGYAPEHDEWKSRRELLQSAPEAVAEFDALQQPSAALAQVTMERDVTVTGTPPAPRLVGIETNPGPCNCGGTVTTAVSCCSNRRCPCVVAGQQCTVFCKCQRPLGRLNHVCHREPSQRPLPTAAEEASRALVIYPAQGRTAHYVLRQMPGVDRGSAIVTPEDVMEHIAYTQTLYPPGAVISSTQHLFAAVAAAATALNH